MGGELGEAHIERNGGRTVYYREFSGRYFSRARLSEGETLTRIDILEVHPNNARIVIDGEVHVRCGWTMRGSDTITLAGLGAFDALAADL